MNQPPRFWEWLLTVVSHAADEAYLLGDLQETYLQVEEDYSTTRARNWYRRQVLLSLPHLMGRTLQFSSVMIKNYLQISIRNLRKNLGFTGINMFGLAVGLLCSVLIGLYVISELSFDTHHEKGDRVVRLIKTADFGGGAVTSPITAAPFGPMFAAAVPEFETYFRLRKRGPLEIFSDGKTWFQDDVMDADPSMLDVLSIDVRVGAQNDVLEAPFSLLLSESVAVKIYGTTDVVGQTMVLNDDEYGVEGVFEDDA